MKQVGSNTGPVRKRPATADARSRTSAAQEKGVESDDDASAAKPSSDPSISLTLVRGLEILSSFSAEDEHLSNSVIAARLGLNKATVSRLCKTLVQAGFLRRDPKGDFRLAPKILSLSYPILSATRWRHQFVGVMEEIAAMASGNVTLALMSGDRFVQVQTAGQPSGFPHIPEPGVTGPLHRSASGRALLSLLQGEALEAKLGALRQAFPEEYDANHDAVLAAIDRCKREGFCTSYGDWRPSIVAVSAPVGVTEDGLYVTLSCGLPRYRAREEVLESDLGPRMAEAARTFRLSNLFELPSA